MKNYRYGMRKYMDDYQVMYEVIDVYENAHGERRWNESFAIGDDPEHLIRIIDVMMNDLKNLRTPQGCIPDVTTTLYDWWWTDTPDVKYSTGMREDEEETERVCAGL